MLPVHKLFEKLRSLDYPYINGMGLSWHQIIWTVLPWSIQEATFQGMIPTLRGLPVENKCSLFCIYASYRYHHWSANNFDAGLTARVDSILIEGKVRPNQEYFQRANPFCNWMITNATTFDTYDVSQCFTLTRGRSLRLRHKRDAIGITNKGTNVHPSEWKF